jgi:hypothetical protein
MRPKQPVKQANLAQYRIVYFGTHGLVSGELEQFAQSQSEPALVLTIPENPTDGELDFLHAATLEEMKRRGRTPLGVETDLQTLRHRFDVRVA